MTTIQPRSFFDSTVMSTPSAVDLMSAAERLEYNQKLALNPPIDPQTKALADAMASEGPLGRFGVGTIGGFTAYAGARFGSFINGLVSDDEAYSQPMNFEFKPKKERQDPFNPQPVSVLPFTSDHSIEGRNNIEGFAEDLQGIPAENWAWLLSSTSYGQYAERLDLIRMATPEFASQGSTAGRIAGFVGDTASIILMSTLAEPLVFAGDTGMFIRSGQRIAQTMRAERFGNMYRVAEEAAEASEAFSRLGGVARYAALGLGEEAAIKIAKYAIDPLYDPDAKHIAWDATLAMGFGGLIGGFAARHYAANQIRHFAEDFIHQMRNGDGVSQLRTPLAFVTTAAADRTLLGDRVLPVGETVDGIADDAFEAFSRTGRENVPGTESVALPVLQGEGAINRADDVGAAMLTGRERPADFGPSMFTPANENFITELLNEGRGRIMGWRGALARATGMPLARGELARSVRRGAGLPERMRPSGVFMTNRRGSRQLAAGLGDDVAIDRALYPGGTGRGTGIEVELATDNLRGSFVQSESLFAGAQQGDVAFQHTGTWRNLNRSARSVTIAADAEATQASRVREMLTARGWRQRALADGSTVFTPPGQPMFRAANEGYRAAVTGVQSSILGILADIHRRGGPVTQDMARAVGRALFAAEAEGLRGVAFENRVWSTVERFLPTNVTDRLRQARAAGNTTRINSVDQAFNEIVNRQQTIEGLWQHFEEAVSSAPLNAPTEGSLILQVANEVRMRGGNVDRRIFEEIVEDIRSIMQNPPMRRNARGVMMLDSRQRLAQVAEVINRRVGGAGEQIRIPRALQNNIRRFGEHLNTTRRAAIAAEEARLRSGAPAVPGAPSAPPAAGGAAGGAGGAGGAVGGAAGGAPPGPPAGGNSITGAHNMNTETPRLTGSDTLGWFQKFFNQAAVVLRFENPAARSAMMMMFNTRRAMATTAGVDVAQGHTIFEQGTYEMTGFLARGLTSYRNGYTRFALNRGAADSISLADNLRAGFGRGARQRIAEFNAAVAEQVRTGNFNHANDGVNATAREVRQILNEAHQAASAAGVRGFQTSGVVNYLPRLWRWDRIQRLGTTVEGRQQLENLLERALGGTTGTRQIVTETGQVVDLPDVRQAATVLADRLINISRDSDLAPVFDIDQQIATAMEQLLGPVSPGGASRTPFGRARIVMDEMADVATPTDLLNSGRNGISIADLTVNDMPQIMKKYMVSVFGAINERRLIDGFNAQMARYGINDAAGNAVRAETTTEMISIINRIGNLDPAFGGSMPEEVLAAFNETLAALRYEPLHRSTSELSGLNRLGDAVLGVMLPLGYLSTGGAFGLVAASETSRIIGTLGLRSVAKQMPIMGEMLQNWNTMDEGPRNMARMIDQIFHPSTDRLRRVLMQQVQNQYGTESNQLIRGLNSIANFFSDVTLLTPVTSFTQHLMAASTIQHLYDVGINAARRLDDATVRTLGLEPNQYDDLIDYIRTNAVLSNRAGSTRVVDLQNIQDIRMDNLRGFIDRAVRTRIQDMPTRGDFHRIGFTWYGRFLTQFRAFNLKGVDNFALQNISRLRRGDTGARVRVAQEIGATMLFAAMIQYSRNLMDVESLRISGDYEKAKKQEDLTLGLSGFIRGGLAGPSEFFLPMMAIDTAWTSTVSDDPLFSSYRYSGLNMYGFPAQSFVSKTMDVSKDMFGATVAKWAGLEDKERDITKATVHKFRLLLPFQNVPGIKHFFNLTEAEIANEFMLLDRQTRRAKIED